MFPRIIFPTESSSEVCGLLFWPALAASLLSADTFCTATENSCSQWQSKGGSHDPPSVLTEEEVTVGASSFSTWSSAEQVEWAANPERGSFCPQSQRSVWVTVDEDLTLYSQLSKQCVVIKTDERFSKNMWTLILPTMTNSMINVHSFYFKGSTIVL